LLRTGRRTSCWSSPTSHFGAMVRADSAFALAQIQEDYG
jgi:hypothetical protein